MPAGLALCQLERGARVQTRASRVGSTACAERWIARGPRRALRVLARHPIDSGPRDGAAQLPDGMHDEGLHLLSDDLARGHGPRRRADDHVGRALQE